MTTPKYLECVLRRSRQSLEPCVLAIGKQCTAQWLEARYDYNAFNREILGGLPNREEARHET